jgi:hypothetical protein
MSYILRLCLSPSSAKILKIRQTAKRGILSKGGVVEIKVEIKVEIEFKIET